MCANVTLRLCANDLHFCAQMKNVRKRTFWKMCANVIAPNPGPLDMESDTISPGKSSLPLYFNHRKARPTAKSAPAILRSMHMRGKFYEK